MKPWVRETDKRLAAVGGCARFGMDDGYMVGPRKVIFGVLEDFAKGIREGTGCELVAKKCKMFNLDENARGYCNRKGLISQEFKHMEEGIYVNKNGDMIRGVSIFNVSIGEPVFVDAVLRDKAKEVAKVTRQYVQDLEEDYQHELWTILQYSLQHRVTYWLRTCTPEETEGMAELVDAAILEAVHAAT